MMWNGTKKISVIGQIELMEVEVTLYVCVDDFLKVENGLGNTKKCS